jgi:phenylpropionate dioxygenase-like ring-hydroxylating dioxygenase large terminal subunit
MDFNETSSEGWVDAARGLVSRDAFVSEDVYRLELERVFGRSWVYLAHETEIAAPGDFATRSLAGAPVVLVRETDGSLHGHLNSCRHRGTKVCRVEAGNARHFVCPYHGWAYARNGRLITTTFDRHFPEGVDDPLLGLVPIPRLESYKGLIFGSWQDDIVDLPSYLGDFRWYLDAFFARTPQGLEVLGPPHRWRAKANWKMGTLNFIGDSQHVVTTHVGPTSLDPLRLVQAGLFAPGKRSLQLITQEGHGGTFSYLKEDLPEHYYQTHPADLLPLYDQALSPEQRQFLAGLRVAVANVFPNFSFIEGIAGPAAKVVIIRQWQPVSAMEMEILSWCLVEREASAAYKEQALRAGPRLFGVSGVFEQDDLELWASSAAASDNHIARQHPFGFQTGRTALAEPMTEHGGPGRAWRPVDCEIIQLEFMRHWQKRMQADV